MPKKKKSSFAGITSGNLLNRKRGVNFYVLGTIAAVLAGVGVYLTVFSHAGTNAPLLVASGNDIGQVNATTHAVTNISNVAAGAYATSERYSPDYSQIAWVASKGITETVTIYDVATKKVTATVALPNNLDTNSAPVQWLPDGKSLLVAAGPVSTPFTNNNLYLVKTDGSAATKVANVNVPTGLTDLAVSGDGKYYAYMTSTGIYTVKPGAKPVVMYKYPANSSCGSLVARPGASEEFAYDCSSAVVNNLYTDTIVDQKIGGKPKVITTSNNSMVGTANGFGDMTWSSDGKNIALHVTTDVYISHCNTTNQNKIAMVAASGVGGIKVLTSDPSHQAGCLGGGSGGGKSIAWNSLTGTIAYIDTGLYASNNLYEIASTGGPNNVQTQIKGTELVSVSW